MEVELVAGHMAAGGDAIAREASGRVVFLAGALPGERVRAVVTVDKRDYAKAVVAEVLEPSADRVDPPCPNVERGCGGCSWQHIRVERQRELKAAIVADALRRTARLPDAEVVSGPGLPASAFRTTARLAVDREGHLGYRARRSHDVVATSECLVLHPLLEELLRGVRLPGAGEVTLRCGGRTGERAMAWTELPGRRVAPAGVPADVGHGWQAPVTEIVDGHRLTSSLGSFVQASPEAAEALTAAVRAAAGEELGARNQRVVDAYGGTGLFAVAACHPDADVVLVESSPAACADARANLSGRRATVVETPVERWRPVPASLVIADPSRQGLGRGGVAVLEATGCHRLVLVSCDPVSMARDAALLSAAGFAHRGSTVLDPFPHTAHVEIVTRFDRVPN